MGEEKRKGEVGKKRRGRRKNVGEWEGDVKLESLAIKLQQSKEKSRPYNYPNSHMFNNHWINYFFIGSINLVFGSDSISN